MTWSPLVVEGRYGETRSGYGAYLKVARRVFNEAQLTGIGMPSSINVECLVVTYNITVLVSPLVVKSIRSVTYDTWVITAVLRFYMRRNAVHSEVRVAVVNCLIAV